VGLQRAQRCLGQRGVAQALRLDETGQDLIWQRVAMGLLLFRLAKGLLLRDQALRSGRSRAASPAKTAAAPVAKASCAASRGTWAP
jgi:hypothetical protein